MLTQEIKSYVRNYCARVVRKSTIKGRAGVGVYSVDGYPTDPSEPDSFVQVKRGAIYGLTSECPDGTESVHIGVNGSTTSRVSVSELVQETPAVDRDGCEVLLWCINGQRILLDKDGNVIVTPAAGKEVRIGGTKALLTQDVHAALVQFATALNTGITATAAAALLVALGSVLTPVPGTVTTVAKGG